MGSQESTSTSTPLNSGQRADIYRSAIENTGSTDFFLPSTYEELSYKNPQYRSAGSYAFIHPATNVELSSPGDAKTLSDGDYAALEKSIYDARTAPVSRKEQLDRKAMNEDLARRGIWSSGVAAQAQNDITEAYAPQYAQAAGEATNQRYNLQANELSGINQYAQERANAANSFNQNNATRLDSFNQNRETQYNQWTKDNAAAQNAFNLQNANYSNNFAADQANKSYESRWRKPDYRAGLWNGTGGAISSGSSGGWSI